MILEGILQFLAAAVGTVAFSVLFSVPKSIIPSADLSEGQGWLICWIFINGLGTGAIIGNFAATVLSLRLPGSEAR